MDVVKGLSWYNLPLNKDERKLIYNKLDWVDWTLGRIAHNVTTKDTNHIFKRLTAKAAKRGYTDILRWIRPYYNFSSREITRITATYGHLELLEWIGTKHRIPIYECAAEHGHLPIIQWMIDRGEPVPSYACWLALLYKHRDVFICLAKHSAEMSNGCRNDAKQLGWIE